MKLKRKIFSYLKPSLIGAAGGGIIGAGTNLYRNRNEKGSKLGTTLRGATVGAGLGAGIGAATKYGVKRYKKWIGPVKTSPGNTPIDVSQYKPGDIIIADRGFMKHYGIVVDNKGNIIEYGSKKRDPRMASIRKVSIQEFKGTSPISKENPTGRYTREQIVQRAEGALGKDNGIYNLRNNNCEHFARIIANGDNRSTQVDNLINPKMNKVIDRVKEYITPKNFSNPAIKGEAINLLSTQGKLLKNKVLNSDMLFKIRGNLTKDLGGLSHIDKYQTHYLAGGGSVLGGTVGSIRGKRKAKKDAVNKYGLKKGTLEYDNYVRSRAREGLIKGAAIGGASGFGLSKGIDTARGKVIADKMAAKYGYQLEKPGRNYMKFGKNMRGINSEETVQRITDNWQEVGDFAKNMYRAL